MEIINTVISFGAFLLSGISILWQFKNSFVDLKIDVIKIYKLVNESGVQYIIRLHFINNASSPVSVSKIIIKNNNNKIPVDYSKLRLIKNKYKTEIAETINGETKITEEITGKGNLYSRPLPFRIDGDGCEGGDFYLFDPNNILNINNSDIIEIEIYTNKKKLTLSPQIVSVGTWEELEVCLE